MSSFFDSLVTFLTSTLVVSLWVGLLVSGVMQLLRWVLHRDEQIHGIVARNALGVFLCSMMASIVVIAYATEPRVIAVSHAGNTLGHFDLTISHTLSTIPRTVADSSVPWREWCASVWLAGFLISAVRLTRSWRNSRVLAASAEPVSAQFVLDSMPDALVRFWRKRGVQLCLSASADTPCTVGVRRPMVLLPRHCQRDYSHDEVMALVTHESAHILRQDVAKNHVLCIIGVLLWFNPFFKWFVAGYAEFRELDCDRRALDWIEDRKAMATALARVSLSASSAQHAMTFLGNRKSMLLRIRRILAGATNQTLGIAMRSTLLGCVCFSAAASVFALSLALSQNALTDQRAAYLSDANRFDLGDFQYGVCRQLREDGIYQMSEYGRLGEPIRLVLGADLITANGMPLPRHTQTAVRRLANHYGVAQGEGHFFQFFGEDQVALGVARDGDVFGERIGPLVL